MKKFHIFTLLLLTSHCFIFSQETKKEELTGQAFGHKNEIYFSFLLEEKKDIHHLTRIISIDDVSGNLVLAYANKKEFADFLDYTDEYIVLPHPGDVKDPVMKDADEIKEAKAWDYYPTYSGYVTLMNQFQSNYPQLCKIVNIGTSINGRQLLFAKISDNVNSDEPEPEFIYTSSMHGDETTGYVLMLHLIDYLLTNYGLIPRITNLVNNMEIWINPLANPDGTYAGGNNTVSGATRYNANGVDLNRNYPDPQDGPHPDGHPWQVETVAFMNFAEARNFVAGANFHGGVEVANYPWDTWSTLAADDAWWQYVCHEYADTAQAYGPVGYFDYLDDGITNGYAWYEVAGGRQDYMNYFQQCREVTLEISNTKLLPAGQLLNFWNYNYRSLLNYMEQATFGLRGIVTDSVTGQPIFAKVYVLNHELDSSWVYTDMPAGNYHRLLHAGTYTVQYSAPGYFPKTYTVPVANKIPTIRDVQLVPGNIIADFAASNTNINAGTSINFTDLTYGNALTWNWVFEGANPPTSSQQNPAGINYPVNGSYDVTLTVSDGTYSNTLTKTDYINVTTQFNMGNMTVTTCSGQFYDSGGPGSNYGNNLDFTMTFYPQSANGRITVQFSSFELEAQSNCSYDYLKIYNGPGTTSPLLGTWCGTNSPGTLTSTHVSGALTFKFHSDNSVTKPGWNAQVYCTSTPFTIQSKAFLQGPYNGLQMNTNLISLTEFPLSQPFSGSPWYYTGTESVTSIPNQDIVDWVLMELRDAGSGAQALSSTVVARKACFLLNNGNIVNVDGSSPPSFNLLYQNALFVVLWHRNHLGIMSSSQLSFTSNAASYDFSTGSDKVYGGASGYRQIGPAAWGMVSGDGTADQQVNNNDKNNVWKMEVGTQGYKAGDFNLDKQVTNIDKTSYWTPNTGLGSQVPE